jgi:hypothetical protein
VQHVSALEDRYLRTYGECLTFGSGDCGQLAHGIENDEDLMVKYPRVVYSLRYALYWLFASLIHFRHCSHPH